MAGTNGKPKFLRVNREEEVQDLKVRGTIYQYLPASFVFTNSISAAFWSQAHINFSTITPNALTGPTVDSLYQLMSQEAPGVVGESGELIIGNTDPVNAKVITLPAGWTPSTLTVPAGTAIQVRYQISSTNPLAFVILSLESLGSALPANNTGVAPAAFGADFALTPALPYDVIVRNAANTQWVPSVSGSTGGIMPWGRFGGTIAPPTLFGTRTIVDVDDGLHGAPINTYTHLLQVVNRIPQASSADFDIASFAAAEPSFGTRGPGTTDNIIRTRLVNPPGAQPTSFHIRSTILGVGDVFHVRSSGETKVTLSAGPPVTNIAVDAQGQICAAASSVTVKENIINATDTTAVNTIQVREFNYIGDDVKQIGAIVQEMEPLIPEALRPALINYKINWAYTDDLGVFHPMTRDLTKPESINLQGVVFCLMRELQALRARVAVLEP